MHSFFCRFDTAPGGFVRLSRNEEDHLFRTLRARSGDEVELLDGNGGVARARVRPDRALELLELHRVPEPESRLLLCTAVPRRAKFDVLLKQAAELGVREIRLIECERSVARPEGSDRWQTLLQEGCKQSGNPFLPEIFPPVRLGAELDRLRNVGALICFGAVRPGDAVPAGKFREAATYAWLVGPEGGFTPSEEEQMLAAGAVGVNLGPYVLRLETAAVCGLAVLRQRMMEAER